MNVLKLLNDYDFFLSLIVLGRLFPAMGLVLKITQQQELNLLLSLPELLQPGFLRF